LGLSIEDVTKELNGKEKESIVFEESKVLSTGEGEYPVEESHSTPDGIDAEL
jgi:hypothetical protein